MFKRKSKSAKPPKAPKAKKEKKSKKKREKPAKVKTARRCSEEAADGRLLGHADHFFSGRLDRVRLAADGTESVLALSVVEGVV